MAILGSTTLTDCYYIPSFINSGTRSTFENSFAPTSWTKDTSYSTNGVALRVVTGSVGIRTSFTFSQTLTQRDLSVTINQNASAVTLSPSSANISLTAVAANQPFVTDGSVQDLPAHSHQYTKNRLRPGLAPGARPAFGPDDIVQSGNEGSSNQHSHTISFQQHNHTVVSDHTHTTSGQHNHTVPAPVSSEDFAVIYRDVIIASKD